MDWLGIRNWCRQRCMDSVSVETSVENEYIKKKLVDGEFSKEAQILNTEIQPDIIQRVKM